MSSASKLPEIGPQVPSKLHIFSVFLLVLSIMFTCYQYIWSIFQDMIFQNFVSYGFLKFALLVVLTFMLFLGDCNGTTDKGFFGVLNFFVVNLALYLLISTIMVSILEISNTVYNHKLHKIVSCMIQDIETCLKQTDVNATACLSEVMTLDIEARNVSYYQMNEDCIVSFSDIPIITILNALRSSHQQSSYLAPDSESQISTVKTSMIVAGYCVISSYAIFGLVYCFNKIVCKKVRNGQVLELNGNKGQGESPQMTNLDIEMQDMSKKEKKCSELNTDVYPNLTIH